MCMCILGYIWVDTCTAWVIYMPLPQYPDQTWKIRSSNNPHYIPNTTHLIDTL